MRRSITFHVYTHTLQRYLSLFYRKAKCQPMSAKSCLISNNISRMSKIIIVISVLVFSQKNPQNKWSCFLCALAVREEVMCSNTSSSLVAALQGMMAWQTWSQMVHLGAPEAACCQDTHITQVTLLSSASASDTLTKHLRQVLLCTNITDALFEYQGGSKRCTLKLKMVKLKWKLIFFWSWVN